MAGPYPTILSLSVLLSISIAVIHPAHRPLAPRDLLAYINRTKMAASSTCGDTILHAHFLACFVHVLLGQGFMGELRVGGRRRGGEDVAAGSGDDSASESMAASLDSGASSGSLCSSIMSSLTDDDDDDAESTPVAGDPTPSDTMQLDGGGGGPLYELSPLLAHLPVRTGLSKYYKGKSQSFTSLSDVKCLQDLAKKTTAQDHRPHRQEGEPFVDFASRSRALQQDDSEEDGAEGFIGPGAVKSMEQGLSAQKR